MGLTASRFAAGFLTLVLGAAACTSSTYISSVTPGTSPSASASAEASPSPSPTPSPAGPLTITAVPVHDGEMGQPFAPITLAATGGLPPYSWAVGTGALPGGLALSAGGVITGQLTKDGAFKFTVAVADSGGAQASKAASITIFKALAVKGTCAQLCVIGKGCTKCGSFGSVTGGQAPYSYKVTGGTVPAGMSLSGLSLKGGFPAGSYSLTVQVSDKLGVKATAKANWSVYTPAVLTSGGDCLDTTSTPTTCTMRWTYSGGNPTVAPKLTIVGYSQNCNQAGGNCQTPTTPPPGWSVAVKSGVVTISAGSSACVVSYIGTVRLALVDPASCATSASNVVNLKVDLEYAC